MGIALVIGLAFVLLGLALVVGGAVVFFRLRRQHAAGLQAGGVVVELARGMGGRGYIYYPVVEYQTITGRAARFRSDLGQNPAGYRVGQEVKVRYQPDNPEKAEIDSAAALYFHPGCLLAMGLGFSLLGACLSAMMLLVLLGPASG